MNFIHFGDTHLGASNFKLKQREQDFMDSFKQVIDYALAKKPEFIVHSGDLFDKGKPGNKVLLFTIQQLIKLKKAGIPLLIVPGSHDMSVDGTFITILEQVGLLTNVAKPENFEQQGDKFLMKGEEVGGAIIYGVPGRRANIQQIYESLKTMPSNKFKLFIFHHIVTNVKGAEYFADIPISSLPQGMDYYGGGHWHEYEVFDYQGSPVVYPGSTEYHNIDSMELGQPRGFIHYQDKPIFISLKNREVIVKEVQCDGLSPDETINKCISLLKKSDNGLIIFKLKGVLGSGLRNELNTHKVKEVALSKGYLHCSIKIGHLSNPGQLMINNDLSINEVERGFLKKKGYAKSEVELAMQLIKLLGRDYKPSEFNKALQKAGELI